MTTTVVVTGIVLGVAYTLSPLTVISLGAIAGVTWWIQRHGMSARERTWFISVVGIAVALRLLAIAALFLMADSSRPYASFFGDEELFKQRTVWLRNVFLGVPIAPADMIYVFDEVGRSSYLYFLAYIQALVGDAPYGLNVLNASWYVIAVLILFALVRNSLGRMPALGGLLLMLFIPTLFTWSVSVLKEALYMLVGAIELVCAVQIVRARSWWWRGAAVVAVVICAYALESLRIGGWLLAVVGATAGVASGVILSRPRWATVGVLVAPIVFAVAVMQPAIQERVMYQLRVAAFNHWGHVATPGFSYRLLEPHYYMDARTSVFNMTMPETGRFIMRAFYNFVTVPRPSQVHSRSALAYLPEQAVWYSIVLLLPIGVVAAFRRDPLVTCLLVSHGLVAAGMVALTGGNIGTLIRHRGLTIPYFSWLAAFGACHIVHWLAVRRTATALPSGEHA